MKHTFVGSAWRVQVTILDVFGRPPEYTVYVLRSNERSTVSFRECGDRVYHGISSSDALSALLHRVPDAERHMPRKMRSFFRLGGSIP